MQLFQITLALLAIASSRSSFFSSHPSSVAAAVIERRQSCVKQDGQCGGRAYSGTTCCEAGLTCVVQSEWYSQCKAGSSNSGPVQQPPVNLVDPAKDFRKAFPGSNPNYYWRNEGECTKPFVRKEWRKMSKAEQKAYVDAVNCANNQKAISTAAAPGAKTRYDDFCGSHIRQSDFIHNVGHFLPWHRMFVAFFEEYLAAECGYTGGLPYWDWTLDSNPATFPQSPIFSSDGFGGNGARKEGSASSVGGFEFSGRTGGGCVSDGAFKNMTVSLGPGNSLRANPRCLERDLVPELAVNFEPSRVEKIMAQTTYETFDAQLEPVPAFNGFQIDVNNAGVHAAGHFVIGGSLGAMGNVYSSCGDPTFFLHHAQLDRLWWIWQNKAPNRIYEIGGRTTRGEAVTLDFKMNLNELTSPWPNLTVREMMNIKGGPLCYDYE